MKIDTKIKSGLLKGWTIRKSKKGWYDLYSYNGISQTGSKNTLDEINTLIERLQKKPLVENKRLDKTILTTHTKQE